MTIWTFGDSFSKHFEHLPESWVERTARTLGTSVISYSKPLSTLEYTFYKFDQERNNIKENDIVIIGITTLDRRWFFKDIPFRLVDLTPEQSVAIDYYNTYLNHYDEIHKTYVENFLFNVNYFTKKLNVHTIVFPNFFDFDPVIQKIHHDLSHLHIVRGRIGIVSDNEFKPEIVSMAGPEWFMKSDIRLNHLIKSNHKILSDKVLDNIKNKTMIDITKDMVTGLLDDNMLTNPEFFKDELFDGLSKVYNKG